MTDANDVPEQWEFECAKQIAHWINMVGGGNADGIASIIYAYRVANAPQPDAVALGAELIAWAADASNAVAITDDGGYTCIFCGSWQIDDDIDHDPTRNDVVHWPNCLHLRAKAIVAASTVRAAGNEGGG